MENILTLTAQQTFAFNERVTQQCNTRCKTNYENITLRYIRNLHPGAMMLNITNISVILQISFSLRMVKGAQDGETFQQKKIQ